MVKKTAQTKFIYNFIKSTKRHPSAEEIFNEASQNLPYITRATVYNVLRRLLKSGEVKELYIKKGLTVFDGNTSSHPHLKCKVCGRVEDIEVPGFEKIVDEITEKYRNADVELNVYSVCDECKSKLEEVGGDEYQEKSSGSL